MIRSACRTRIKLVMIGEYAGVWGAGHTPGMHVLLGEGVGGAASRVGACFEPCSGRLRTRTRQRAADV